MRNRTLPALLVVCLLAIGTALAGGPNATSTAQSVGVNTNLKHAYTFHDKTTYAFDSATAATYFTNSQVGAPTLSCSGNGCGVCTAPGATAPAPDPTVVNDPNGNGKNDWVGKNECIFLDGGYLLSTTYTQAVKTNTVSCANPSTHGPSTLNATYTYTFPYVVGAPADPVAPYTAWIATHVSDGTPVIPLNIDIAGESVVVSKNFPTGKYSFSLDDPITITRVTGVSVTILDSTGTAVLLPPPVNGALITDPPARGVNFRYSSNAGTYGGGTALGCITTGTRSSFDILNGVITTGACRDQFAGNNNGGSDGAASEIQHLNEIDWTWPPTDDYHLIVAGTVKGNGAVLDQAFKVNTLVQVITPGCSANVN